MSDEVLSLSELSSKEGSKNSSTKKAKKRKSPDSFSNDSDKREKKKCKIQSENLDGNKNEKKVIKPKFVAEITPSTSNSDSTFQNFIKVCLGRRSDGDTKTVLGKLQKLYNKLSASHKSDDKFKLYINACLEKITKNLSKDIYTPMLDLRTEIKNRIQAKLKDEATIETAVDSEELSVEKKRQIEQVEESIKKCRLKIKELQEREVDFDEEQDSAYIQEDKYKKKLVQLCKCLSELTGNTKIKKQIFKKKIRRKDIPGDMTGNSLLDEAVINLVNCHIGKINKLKYLETEGCVDPIKMPDYVDVLRCIQKSNRDNDLDLSEEKITKLAKRAFKDLGNFLKKKRINDTEWYFQSLVLEKNEDPAEKDVELQRKLQTNKTEGDKRLQLIFDKYLKKQDDVDKEDTEKQTGDEESFDDENEDKDETAILYSDEKTENSKDEKDTSNKKEKEILETNTTAKSSFHNVHQMLKSKEKLKSDSDTDTAIKHKETLKDHTATKVSSKSREAVENTSATKSTITSKDAGKKGDAKAISKSQETVKKKTAIESTPSSKEAVKNDAKAISKSQEAVKKKTAIESTPSSKEAMKNDAKAISKSQETLKKKTVTEPALSSKKAVEDDTKATSKSQEIVKKNTVTEPAVSSKKVAKDNAVTRTVPKSKETLKNNVDSVIECKESMKDDKAPKPISKSQEAVKKKSATEPALTSKEIVKDKTVIDTAPKSKEPLKNNGTVKPVLASKEIVKDKIALEAALKPKETLKNDADTATKSKEALKDNIVTKATPKSQELVLNNSKEPASTVKESLKADDTVKEIALQSKETLKNNTVVEASLVCGNSKNDIINEKKESLQKTAQIDSKKDDDDVIIIESSDDDCTEVEKSTDVQKITEKKLPSVSIKTYPEIIMAVDVESFQSISPAITSTPMKTVSHNISPKKLVDLTAMDDAPIKMSFIKVREFAKSSPAWEDDGSIVQTPWLSD